MITIRSYKAGTRELIQEIKQKNTIMLSAGRGIGQLVDRLIGTITYTGIINYGAIGTGNTAPTQGDTKLQTESARTTVANGVNASNATAQIQFFFADSVLANGTYYEFGMFVDGTASADTGRLFNRALFSIPYVKVSGTDTTIECDILFT